MASFEELTIEQEKYNKQHPHSDFNYLDHFQSHGADALMEIFKNAYGKEIISKQDLDGCDKTSIYYKD